MAKKVRTVYGGYVYVKEAEKEKDVWDSEITIIDVDGFIIRVPASLLSICDQMQKVVGHNEFSILFKGELRGNVFEITSEEYVVPEQEVTSSTVEIKEDITPYLQDGFNTVVHSHPFQSSNFSSTDEEYVNSNFQCSILYSQGKFPTACVTIQLNENTKLKIRTNKIELVYPTAVVDEEEVKAKIKTKSYSYCYSGTGDTTTKKQKKRGRRRKYDYDDEEDELDDYEYYIQRYYF